jgi:hypothetical protein
MLLRDAGSTGPVRGRVYDSVTARTVKFQAQRRWAGHQQWAASREGIGSAPIGEPPPGREDDDLLPF